MGAQRMAAASTIEMTMMTFANVGAVAILAFVSPTIQAFFIWQTVAALVTLLTARATAWRSLAVDGLVQPVRFDRSVFRRIWKFSAAMAVTTISGTLFLQSDKIILSKIVTLGELGRYIVAVMAARTLYLLVTPVFGVVYPRMTTLYAAGNLRNFADLSIGHPTSDGSGLPSRCIYRHFFYRTPHDLDSGSASCGQPPFGYDSAFNWNGHSLLQCIFLIHSNWHLANPTFLCQDWLSLS